MLLAIVLTGLSLTACSEDDLDTNQYKGGISLSAYGPQPVMRGGTLRFLGSNLDQIAQVVLPGCDPITNFEVKKSGVPSEIWVTVPEEAEEGLVTLITKTDQKITTVTELSFEEPITITKFSPMEVMPGETITIEGQYLELVQMVQFNNDDENVYVGQDDFIEHTRYKIVLKVPETARTGKLNLYTLDLTNEENDPNDMTYNIIETEDALTVGTPTVSKLKGREEVEAQGSITAKTGETITITGEHFNLVDWVAFGDNEDDLVGVGPTVSEDGKTITVELTGLEPDGSINLVTRSGVEVPVGKLVTVAPTNCVATPSPVKAGQPLTITGNDLDVVYQVVFLDKDGKETAFTSTGDNKFTRNDEGTQIVVSAVPEAAVEGNLILRMYNDKETNVAFTLVKPVVTGYNSASVSAGGALELNGTDLDLVKSVDFGGAVVESSAFTAQTETGISLTVPMEAKSGAPTLTMANGATVTAPELTINEAVFCYATALPSAEDEIKAGTSATLTVKNMDKLTGVEIDGETCKFVTSGEETLIIGVPETAGVGSKVRLISSNGEVTYTVDFVPASEVAKVLYKGPSTLGWGDDIKFDASTFANIPADATLTISYTRENNTWVQIWLEYQSEGWPAVTPFKVSGSEGEKDYTDGHIVPTDVAGWGANDQEIVVTLPASTIANIVANGGFHIRGGGGNAGDCIINKVTLNYTIPSETTIWAGEQALEGNMDINFEIKGNLFAGQAKAGQTLRFYVESTGDDSAIKLFDGHWGGLNFENNSNSNVFDSTQSQWKEHAGYWEVTLTADEADRLNTYYDWGYCMIVQGQRVVLKKIALE